MTEEEIVTTRAETEVTERTGDPVEDGKMIEEEDTEMMSEDPGESQDGVVMTGLRMCPIVCRTWQQMLQSHCLICQIFRTLTITELVSLDTSLYFYVSMFNAIEEKSTVFN